MSVFYIFLYRRLHLSPLVLGIVFGTANLGIGGAFFASKRRVADRRAPRACAGAAIWILGCPTVSLESACVPAVEVFVTA